MPSKVFDIVLGNIHYHISIYKYWKEKKEKKEFNVDIELKPSTQRDTIHTSTYLSR